jgi:sulfur transfer complex TusBCD TusB component (DsrH family)
MTKLLFYIGGRNALWGREIFGLRLAKALKKHYDEVIIQLANNACYFATKAKTPESAALTEAIKAGCKAQVMEDDLAYRNRHLIDLVRPDVKVVSMDQFFETVYGSDKAISW